MARARLCQLQKTFIKQILYKKKCYRGDAPNWDICFAPIHVRRKYILIIIQTSKLKLRELSNSKITKIIGKNCLCDNFLTNMHRGKCHRRLTEVFERYFPEKDNKQVKLNTTTFSSQERLKINQNYSQRTKNRKGSFN